MDECKCDRERLQDALSEIIAIAERLPEASDILRIARSARLPEGDPPSEAQKFGADIWSGMYG